MAKYQNVLNNIKKVEVIEARHLSGVYVINGVGVVLNYWRNFTEVPITGLAEVEMSTQIENKIRLITTKLTFHTPGHFEVWDCEVCFRVTTLNGAQWLMFEELKAMENALPCDRYERLKLLDEADKTYRANLAAYDDYVGAPGEASEAVGDADERQDGVAATSVKQVGAARKTLSKYRQQLARLVTDGDERAEEVRGRLQEAVRVIQAAGAGFAPATQSELEALGVKF